MCSNAGAGGLMCRLQRALEQERVQWDQWTRLGLHKGSQLVTQEERDEIQRWICHLVERLSLAPDTLALASCLLDRTLFTTRVQTKYLQCVALSALYIACKICEEPEAVPLVPELVRESGCICSTHELVRMERVLLKRINWDLSLVTPYTFLQLMLVISVPPQNSHIFMQAFRPLLELVLSSYELTSRYAPSTLSLAMFSMVFEWQRCPNWLPLTLRLEQLIGVPSEKLIKCREQLTDVWLKSSTTAAVAIGVDDEMMDTENEFGARNRYNGGNVGFVSAQLPLLTSKENVSPSGSGNGGENGGHVRKRQRRKRGDSQRNDEARVMWQRAKSSATTAPVEQAYIDEIYDAMEILYGKGST